MSVAGDVIAGAALLLSAHATWRAHRTARRQERVLGLEERVHALTIEREAREAAVADKAEVSCSVVKLGSSKYRLKVYNRGKATAKNVSVKLLDSDLVHERDVKEKFPMRALESGQAVELLAFVHMQTKPKHAVQLRWENADGSQEKKDMEVTI